jgi:aspartyl-tRNA synthetase
MVTLCGWVHRRRDHGGLIFIDLRDRGGLTQVVFNPEENEALHKKASDLRTEYVVCVTGEVKRRPKGTENPKIPTGQIELTVNDITILNTSLTPPFEIADETDASEELRFTYRYLDLRRPATQKNLVLRHRVCKLIRDFLDTEGFIEVETPILTKSTPEGARDYLVPSRLNPGKFYALPQSPQLFKQILMISGLEKYFQIVKCFRDEDLRADRQPEFTQLDIEMSFIDEEDVFNLMERLLFEIVKKTRKLELQIPFPRLRYQEAMERFKTDKPDTRKSKDEFAFLWVVDFPLFKYNQEEKRWEMEHHPFTSPKEEDLAFLDKDPSKLRARSYDLVVNGVEIGSGSIRIHNPQMQKKIFTTIGLGEEEAKDRFGFLLEALSFGAPPHGGIAFGLDRLIALLAGTESIREVIAFPKTQGGRCPLTNAPSSISEKQLKELGIKFGRDSVSTKEGRRV